MGWSRRNLAVGRDCFGCDENGRDEWLFARLVEILQVQSIVLNLVQQAGTKLFLIDFEF